VYGHASTPVPPLFSILSPQKLESSTSRYCHLYSVGTLSPAYYIEGNIFILYYKNYT